MVVFSDALYATRVPEKAANNAIDYSLVFRVFELLFEYRIFEGENYLVILDGDRLNAGASQDGQGGSFPGLRWSFLDDLLPVLP